MNAKRLHIFLFLVLMTLSASAQKESFVTKAARYVKNYLDSAVIKSADSNYIVVPKRPWQVIVRHNMDQMRVSMHSVVEDEEAFLDWTPTVRTRTANSIGLWVGYRGYGLGYSFNVRERTGYHFSLGAVGGGYGINLRLRSFAARDFNADICFMPKVPLTYPSDDGEGYEQLQPLDGNYDLEIEEPIRVHSLVIDGYYLFNGKRFSYSAAYDQSTIQIRSAGSLMVGAMWNALSVRYNSDKNAALVTLMRNVGAFKIRQGSLGVGYAYNWVPVRGLLVNVLFMPMVTLYNRQVVSYYDTIMGDTTDDDFIDDEENVSHWSRVTLTYNARASITYNYDRFFFNVNGQYNNHSYKYGDDGDGRVKDWFITTSVGVRF